MCSINCAFVGENNFNIIKMYGTTIKITLKFCSVVATCVSGCGVCIECRAECD
jgi:hypothetical protein